MISFGTASLVEMLWTLVAVPGLLLWTANLRSSLLTIRAARVSNFLNGRMSWAKFGRLLTTSFVFVELTFVLLGVIAMLRPPNPDSNAFFNYLFSGLLILASLLLTYVGKEWRRVDRDLIAAAKVRHSRQKPIE